MMSSQVYQRQCEVSEVFYAKTLGVFTTLVYPPEVPPKQMAGRVVNRLGSLPLKQESSIRGRFFFWGKAFSKSDDFCLFVFFACRVFPFNLIVLAQEKHTTCCNLSLIFGAASSVFFFWTSKVGWTWFSVINCMTQHVWRLQERHFL